MKFRSARKNVHDTERQMCELVRERMRPPYRFLQLGSKNWHAYVEPWIAAGAEAVAIDLDGRENCRRFDLCRPIPPERLGGRFHVITNFGTTEHVEDQAQCWKTIHDLLLPGGYLISTVPSPGHYPDHGIWYPTEAWYRKWAELNGYELELFEPGEPLTELIARKAADAPFVMPDAPMHCESPGYTKMEPGMYALAENQ